MVLTLRQRALQFAFTLLYGPLAGLHEVAGKALTGAAWHGRRIRLLDQIPSGTLLDIGCGEGRLLVAAEDRGMTAIGIDPSMPMLRRARRRGAPVICARVQQLPLLDGSVGAVVCSYPGPWIIEPGTWSELARVLTPGAPVQMLLGGATTVGRGAGLRKLLARVAYGRLADGGAAAQLPTLGCSLIIGSYETRADDWGMAIVWRGQRIG